MPDRPVERLTRRDHLLLVVCLTITAASAFVAVRYFSRAFPEATIDFRYDRAASQELAERFLTQEGIDVTSMKHAALFDADQEAKVFLERSLGLETANAVMRRDVRLWFWHHRWFVPLQEEEYSVDVAPTGEIVSFTHTIPEARAMTTVPGPQARRVAEAFLERVAVKRAEVTLVSESERRLPRRMQRIFTWESKSVRPAGAPYRHAVTVDGDRVSSYGQRLRVPDAWRRDYRELRSKNFLAGNIDAVFLALTIVAALITFVVRLRRGDIHVRFLTAIGIIGVILVAGVSLNSFPLAKADYDTTTSYEAFIAQTLFGTVVQAIGTAILLMIVCGAGEVLYRERLPSHLAMPRLWSPSALTSKRVFLSFVLGYALVAFFFAYQVVFYLVAARFGAWAPADIPYDDMLNTAVPWFAVLFAGFFPALSEEFLSRGFSIPFLHRLTRSRLVAIVAAGMIWGFGHATYPNQPFYIRGLEVGVAGILIGYLMDAFGLLPLLIWHFTVDAFYTSLLLFRSGNAYYVTSAAIASFVFALPMIASIVLYIRNGGFLADADLDNATLPLAPPPPPPAAQTVAPLPDGIPLTRGRIVVAAALVVLALAAYTTRPPAAEDAIDYRTTKQAAKEIAMRHLQGAPAARMALPARVIATPADGFRSWNRDSQREEGGAPGAYDTVAADYIARHSSIERLIAVFRTRIHAATWSVRFFTPKQKEEIFVEVDPRTARVIGYHKYQEERRPGATLEREAALDIARRSFAIYGVDLRAFDLKEALAFQQPARRDWLFHFDERQPIAAAAVRRVTVRVAGSEMTQFAATVKIPENVYREATAERLANVILTVLKIGAIIAIIALVTTGFVTAVFRRGAGWRRALRWAAALAVIPIAGILASYESELFRYSTSIGWETFMTGLVVGMISKGAFQIALIFLAVAGLSAAYPHAFGLTTPLGRRRFGASGLAAAVAAVCALLVANMTFAHIAANLSRIASIGHLEVPQGVALPFPGVLALTESLHGALLGSAAVALILFAFERDAKRWRVDGIVIAILFCVSLDPDALPRQMPLMIGEAVLTALLMWGIGRFLLGSNPVAWPAAIFLAIAAGHAASLLQNSRPDLRLNAIALLIAAALFLFWIAFGTRREKVMLERP